jgi:hypothetical protein
MVTVPQMSHASISAFSSVWIPGQKYSTSFKKQSNVQ